MPSKNSSANDTAAPFDILIQNAKIFHDGLTPVVEDIGIRDGQIAARGKSLPIDNATEVIDGTGQWAMPGLYDIHTHYDLELEVAPALPESTRHGTTTVVIANCSLGLAFGAQRTGDVDPIVDCYARVENIPKPVLRKCADNVTWSNPKEYIDHLEKLPKGPNVITMIPHSMLRIDAMGFQDSVERDPKPAEIEKMQETLRESLKLGYAGFSTDALPFHYLANQPNCHKTIPTQFAKYKEIKQLTQVVRDAGYLWQATPPKDSPTQTLRTFLLTSGFLHKKPLKTTVVAALDITNNRRLAKLGKTLSRLLNSKLINGRFYMQALGAPFKTWSDGAITPLAEEIPELRALNETDLEDRAARLKILDDPDYIVAFKQMWMKGKRGFSLARLKRMMRMEDYAFHRDMALMTIDLCPIEAWKGLTFQTVFERVLAYNSSDTHGLLESEVAVIGAEFSAVGEEADFMLQMLRTFDTDLSWSTVTANTDEKIVRDLIMDPLLIPGFNDCGAHLTNMAFYDVNLRSLKMAAEGGDEDVSYMVKRLTKLPADVFGVAGGTIYEGDQADVILIDPNKLSEHEGEANIQRIYRDEYQHEQLVNRSDGVVPLVIINGKVAWKNNAFSEQIGKVPMGRLLKPIDVEVSAGVGVQTH